MTSPSTVNADPAELAKFSELAHRWWDPQSEFRPLHQINPLRLQWIDQLVPLAGKVVVDIGCGGGILTDAMARKGAEVLGVDLSTRALRVAQLHALEAQTPHVQYREVSAEALAFEAPQAFDVVTCMEMLEHVPDPQATLRLARGLLKPGGLLVVKTPNVDGVYPRWSLKAAPLVGFWGHPEPPGHLFQFSSRTLGSMVTQAGLEVVEVSHDRIPLNYSFGTVAQWFRSVKWAVYCLAFVPLAWLGPFMRSGDDITLVARRKA